MLKLKPSKWQLDTWINLRFVTSVQVRTYPSPGVAMTLTGGAEHIVSFEEGELEAARAYANELAESVARANEGQT